MRRSCCWACPFDVLARLHLRAHGAQRDQGEGAGQCAPSCEKRGEAEVSVRHKVGFYERSEAQVRDELETLARNEAPGVGADSISPLGQPVADGTQRWALWRCGR
jgi:hypothetical protein